MPEKINILVIEKNGTLHVATAPTSTVSSASTYPSDWGLPEEGTVKLAVINVDPSDTGLVVDGSPLYTNGQPTKPKPVQATPTETRVPITAAMIEAASAYSIKHASDETDSSRLMMGAIAAALMAGGVDYFFPDHEGVEE